MQSLRLSPEHMQNMVDHAVGVHPEEACGVIGGYAGCVEQIVLMDNVASEPCTRYELGANEQLKVLKAFEAQGLTWIGVYHSHPQGKPIPSPTDIAHAERHTPNLIHLIIGMKDQQVRLQAWHIHDGQVDEVQLLVGNQRGKPIKPLPRSQIQAVVIATIIGVTILFLIALSLLPPSPELPLP
ncbi:MAG: M67 family metallopeptidase [Anaerolineae bacterium]